eukprot:gene11472-14600_t
MFEAMDPMGYRIPQRLEGQYYRPPPPYQMYGVLRPATATVETTGGIHVRRKMKKKGRAQYLADYVTDEDREQGEDVDETILEARALEDGHRLNLLEGLFTEAYDCHPETALGHMEEMEEAVRHHYMNNQASLVDHLPHPEDTHRMGKLIRRFLRSFWRDGHDFFNEVRSSQPTLDEMYEYYMSAPVFEPYDWAWGTLPDGLAEDKYSWRRRQRVPYHVE